MIETGCDRLIVDVFYCMYRPGHLHWEVTVKNGAPRDNYDYVCPNRVH